MSVRLDYQRPALYGSSVTEISSLGSAPDRIGAPFFDSDGGSLVELGHRFYQGEASQGSFLFRNIGPTNDYPLGHCLVTLVEDDSGNDRWLSRGRVVSDEGGRGVEAHSNRTEWDVIVEDGNVDLRGQAFWENWTRPEETDIERLVALQLYTLNGASSTSTLHRDTCQITVNTSHLAPNSNLVTMPAKKYPAGTQPLEVVRDCAENAGKVFGVVIHHSTNPSHLCLLYIDDQDHSTFASGAIISDQLDEWDPDDTSTPVLEPHWEAGAGTLFQMQTITSHLVMTFGPENVSVTEQAGTVANYDYWAEHYSDGTSTTAAQAIQRAEGLLPSRAQTHVTHKVSVIINPNQVHLFGAGMSLQTKSEVLNVGYTEQYFDRRIAECRFEPRADGRYWAHLNLERPPMLIAPGRGTSGPIPPVQSEPGGGPITDYLWTLTDDNTDDTTGLYQIGSMFNSNWHPGYVHSHVLQTGIGINEAAGRPPISPGTYHFRFLMRRGGTTYNPGGIFPEVTAWDGGVEGATTQGPTITDIIDTTVEFDVVFAAGVDEMAFGIPFNDSFIAEVEVTHGTTSDGFVGTPAPPASTDSGGAIGTSPIYSPSDHQHGWQEADATPIEDAGGYFTGGNVEEALQELGAVEAIDPDDFAEAVHAHGDPTGGFRGARVLRTTDLTTGANNNTVDFDDETYDTDDLWDVGDPSRFTIPAAWDGLQVQMQGNAIWDPAGSSEYAELKIFLNGDDTVPVAVSQDKWNTNNPSPGPLVTWPINVSTGDYFELCCRSGAAATALARADYSISFAIWLVQSGASGDIGAVGPILITDTPAGSPLVFADLLQDEAGTDLLYADAGE